MTKSIFMADHKGFSLLEMSCVLIIISILASAAIPVLTRSFLEKAGEKVSLDISAIEEGARAYFIATGSWPASISILQTGNYLPSAWNAINPFGNSYATSTNGAVFTVSTQVVNGSQIAITNRLPVSSYAGTTVTSSIPPPGASTTGFGSWTSGFNVNQVYQAATDGFVLYNDSDFRDIVNHIVHCYTDSNNPPATERMQGFSGNAQAVYSWPITMPVRKGDYWMIQSSINGQPVSSYSIYWLPVGV